MKLITQEWIDKAESDFRVATREFYAAPPECDAVCFHSQQCVEKYLKAILQEQSMPFERTHDLDFLAESAVKWTTSLANYRDELIVLSAFAVDTRYPGHATDHAEALKCLEIARVVRHAIRTHFQLTVE